MPSLRGCIYMSRYFLAHYVRSSFQLHLSIILSLLAGCTDDIYPPHAELYLITNVQYVNLHIVLRPTGAISEISKRVGVISLNVAPLDLFSGRFSGFILRKSQVTSSKNFIRCILETSSVTASRAVGLKIKNNNFYVEKLFL